MTRALLIRNPVARKALPSRTMHELLGLARSAGWEIDATDTERAGHATELASGAAARGIDVVVVYGGDGTINDAVNGLAGSNTALAVLRGGTANVWAKETRCPRNPVRAMQAILSGERRRVDLGNAGGRYFLLMASAGFDATVVSRVGPRLKRRAGALAYIITGVRAAFGGGGHRVRMSADGVSRDTPLFWLLLSNVRLYGGLAQITPGALVNDGQLDVALMRRGGPLRLLLDGMRVLLKRPSANVWRQRVVSLSIETPGIPVQVDGEPHGVTPLQFDVAPAALDVIVSGGLRSPLWGQV